MAASRPRAPTRTRDSRTRSSLEKARRGGIDVYFEGDSITRRWGTSDAQYREFLDNWTRNFFGWNAANFGWGGDTVQNILWRLTDGELDDVHPKVIVLLAGTNNVGGMPRQGVDAAVVENVASGIDGDSRRDAAQGAGRDGDSDGHHATHRQQRRRERHADDRRHQRAVSQAGRWQAVRYLNINRQLARAGWRATRGRDGGRTTSVGDGLSRCGRTR